MKFDTPVFKAIRFMLSVHFSEAATKQDQHHMYTQKRAGQKRLQSTASKRQNQKLTIHSLHPLAPPKKQTNKPNKQTKQANKQPNNQPTKQTNKQANKQTNVFTQTNTGRHASTDLHGVASNLRTFAHVTQPLSCRFDHEHCALRPLSLSQAVRPWMTLRTGCSGEAMLVTGEHRHSSRRCCRLLGTTAWQHQPCSCLHRPPVAAAAAVAAVAVAVAAGVFF